MYPWAYSLIELTAVLMMGAWLVRILLLGKPAASGVPNRKLFLPAGLFFLLILSQVTPLPPRVVRTLSPQTASLYSTFLADVAPDAGTTGSPAPAEAGTGEAPGAAEVSAEEPLPEAEAGPEPFATTAGLAETSDRAAPGAAEGIVEASAADPFTTARPLSLAPDRTKKEGMLFLSYIALLYLLINYKPEGSERRFVRRIVVAIAVAGVLVASVGILQKVLGATRIYGFWRPFQESDLPFMGPYINANHFAGYMELVIPLLIALFLAWASVMKRASKASSNYLESLQSPENNKIALGIVGLGAMVLTLFLSFSRAGIASFLVSLFVLFLVLARMEARFRPDHWSRIRGAWRTLFVSCFLVFCALALPVFLLKQGGLEGIPRAHRFLVWTETLRMGLDFPVFGVGLDGFSVISPSYVPIPVLFTHAENDYLQLFAETGLLGFGLVLLFFLLFFFRIRRLFRRKAQAFLDTRIREEEATPEQTARAKGRALRYGAKPRRKPPYPLPRTNYWLFWGCAASILSLALHSLADFNLHIPANGLLFFLVLGLMARLLHLHEPVFLFSRRRARTP